MHSKQVNETSNEIRKSSSTSRSGSSNETTRGGAGSGAGGGNNVTSEAASRTVFEISQSYRASNLPPLRVSKRLEESMIQNIRKKQTNDESQINVPIIRHSFHEDMKCFQTVEVESSSERKRERNKNSSKKEASKKKETKSDERRNASSSATTVRSETALKNNTDTNNTKNRLVSFDIYKNQAQNKPRQDSSSKVFTTSDFV